MTDFWFMDGLSSLITLVKYFIFEDETSYIV